MKNALTMPAPLISHHGVFGANLLKVPMASALAFRPIACSAIITGRPTTSVLSI